MCAYHMRGISGIKDTSGIGIWNNKVIAACPASLVSGKRSRGRRRKENKMLRKPPGGRKVLSIKE